MANLGDSLSGPLLPLETAQFLMAQDWVHLAGNHERQLFTQGCGHYHVPRSMRSSTGRLIVNPGSVGLPAYNDIHPLEQIVPNLQLAIDPAIVLSGAGMEIFGQKWRKYAPRHDSPGILRKLPRSN